LILVPLKVKLVLLKANESYIISSLRCTKTFVFAVNKNQIGINIQNQTLSILIFYFFFDCIPLFFAKNSDNLVIFYDFFTVVRIIAYIVRTRKYKIEFIFFIVAESLFFIQKLIFKLNLYQTARSIFSNCLLSLWID